MKIEKKLKKSIDNSIKEIKSIQESMIDFAKKINNPQLSGELHQMFSYLGGVHEMLLGFSMYIKLIETRGIKTFNKEELFEELRNMDEVSNDSNITEVLHSKE